jgi:hypothetical protein
MSSTLELDVLNVAQSPEAKEQPAERSRAATSLPGAVMGILIGFRDEGCTPLVLFPGQSSSAAVPAASAIDVHGIHIGRQVVLIFENGDSRRPIIVGLLKSTHAWPLPEQPGQVELEADGERLIVTAKEQLVLRCGKASITLTKVGKVLIEGAHVSNRSSGVVRIKGGSVQIN